MKIKKPVKTIKQKMNKIQSININYFDKNDNTISKMIDGNTLDENLLKELNLKIVEHEKLKHKQISKNILGKFIKTLVKPTKCKVKYELMSLEPNGYELYNAFIYKNNTTLSFNILLKNNILSTTDLTFYSDYVDDPDNENYDTTALINVITAASEATNVFEFSKLLLNDIQKKSKTYLNNVIS